MNETLISSNYAGGLGNQLFFIYATISYSIDINKIPIFLYKEISESCTYRTTYWNTLFKNLNIVNSFSPNIHWEPICENVNCDKEYLQSLVNSNIMLNGMFQSKHYFIHNLKKINNLVGINTFKKDVLETFKNIFIQDTKFIGIHFRLGDYQQYLHCHTILPDEYYIEALKKIPNLFKHTILVFCEIEDYDTIFSRMSDIASKVELENFKIITEGRDWEQMLMLSLCDHIIMANSTFSWWSAIFSDDANVYIPYKWFFEETDEKLILEGWNIVKF
jgi:hypothetical protein